MNLFISIISHNHIDLINTLDTVRKLSSSYHIVIKNNVKGDILSTLPESTNIHVINENFNKGFGENNNLVFDYCKEKLGMSDEDFFLILNPDIITDTDVIKNWCELAVGNDAKISTVNLYKDRQFMDYDNNIRNFPTPLDYVKSFLLGKSGYHIDKAKIFDTSHCDWAAGSCILFRAGHYRFLNGFDINYFMYCEDIDICFRSKMLGFPIVYFPNVKIVHLANHSNRKIFSKHFIWHIKSILRYLATSYLFRFRLKK
ncbi:glycosyltransferase family 2 protein [Vibrio sp. ECSMB14106]|uniref:glycosyltransferase family 2 protein n=1 Tax=Vibrio sp. ECSMB14106 TaxID=1638949 RepID=UPI00061987C7|nr:glycosyltransferase family 2 protein [Vibrio sp. ECSMB14106]